MLRSPRTFELAALVLIATLLGGCQLSLWLLGVFGDEESGPQVDDEDEIPGVGMVQPTDLGPTGSAPGPLDRAANKLRYVTKDARHIGFNLRTLSKTYALAGAVEIPEWSDPGEGDPRAARDDDLGTAWTCTPGRETTCALGIHFPEPADIWAVRIWAAGPPSGPADAHARVKSIRLHTDEGYSDVLYADERDFAYAILGRPVTTHRVTIEVLDVHDGKASPVLELAELEVYGEKGAVREPLSFDPTTAVIAQAAAPWRKLGMEHKLEGTFVHAVGRDRSRRVFAPGSAVYGESGDRLVLVEQLLQTACTVHQGRYFAIDRKTRVWLPLGDLGGIPGDVFRHAKGEGFAVGSASERSPRMQGLVIDDGVYEQQKTHRAERTTGKEYLTSWGIETDAMQRGGHGLADPRAPCTAGTTESLAPLVAIRDGKVGAPDRWLRCDLSNKHTAYLTTNGPCGSAWAIELLDAKGGRVAERTGNSKSGTRMHVRATDELGLIVEVGDTNEGARAFLVGADDIVDLGEGTALAVRPPAACRSRCDTPFTNARAPTSP